MIVSVIFFTLLILAVFIESVFLPYPIVFITLAVFFLFKQDLLFFIFAFVFSLFADLLFLRIPSGTALFLSGFLVFLYFFKRVFTHVDIRVFMLIVFIAAEGYRFYAGYPFQLVLSIVFFIALMGLGIVINTFEKKDLSL